MSCKPLWYLAGPTHTKQTLAKVTPSTLVPSPQGLAEPTPTERTEAREALSHVVPVTTMAGWVLAYEANRGQSSDVTCRPRLPSAWLSLRRPREQRPEQRPHLSCPPPQWLSERTSTKRTKARAAHLTVIPTTLVAGCTHADQAIRGQRNALTSSARHLSGWLSPQRQSEQRPEQLPHLSCPPQHWLAEPTPNDRTKARAAPATVVPETTV
jgi:hypothetical protein